jgi:hypothetical protein
MKKFCTYSLFAWILAIPVLALAQAGVAGEAVAEEALKIPWVVMFLWPFISTALVGIIKALSDRFEKEVPPQLWPVLNLVFVAVITVIQTTNSPQELMAALPAAVLGALGLNKLLDGAKGKLATVTPAEKTALKKAVADGTVVVE